MAAPSDCKFKATGALQFATFWRQHSRYGNLCSSYNDDDDDESDAHIKDCRKPDYSVRWRHSIDRAQGILRRTYVGVRCSHDVVRVTLSCQSEQKWLMGVIMSA